MGETSSGGNVQADITSMSDYGNRILEESEQLKGVISGLESGFQISENGTRSAEFPALAGLASVSPTVRSALTVQDSAMISAHALVSKFVDGQKALGNITMHMAYDYNKEDVLSAAAFQDEQQDMVEKLREQYENMMPGMGHPAGPGGPTI